MVDETLAGIARSMGAQRPDAPAITFEASTITYAELDRRSNQVGQALVAHGVRPGDRVAVLDKNAPSFFEIGFGSAKCGAVLVAVNWRLAPPEIAHVVRDSQAKVLFVSPELWPQVESVVDDLGLEQVIALGDLDGHMSYEDWRDAAPDDDPGHAADPDEVVVQYYTSGTTGLPKGAMLSNRNLMSGIEASAEELGIDEHVVALVGMPLFHVSGSAWGLFGLAVGAHTVMTRDVDLNQILEYIPKYRITHTVFVPAVLQFLLMTPGVEDVDCSSLELIIYGASPISREVLVASIDRFGCGFAQAYGLTETSGGVVVLPPEDHDPDGPHPERLQSAGHAGIGVELRIVDLESGEEAPTGEVGEIWIRGPEVMVGYWNLPEATAAAITPDGWFRSGDLGYLDADGYLYLNDRVKDMIISGGENIYPAEVENALMSHPAVADVGVIGVPDDQWGETVKAIVVRAPGATVTERELIAYAREHLAHYKAPRSIDWADALPRTPSGKILKRDLRAPYWEGRERQVS
jgi:acyl-CoA synthetase (AMP-forming)/AMP-acid ligase II